MMLKCHVMPTDQQLGAKKGAPSMLGSQNCPSIVSSEKLPSEFLIFYQLEWCIPIPQESDSESGKK